jgi:hypothetical protein
MDPFRFVMWLRSLKLVLLLDKGELHVVAGCDFEPATDGVIELC